MDRIADCKFASDANHDASTGQTKHKCTDMFRITRPEPWAFNTGIWSLFSSEPKLRFQISQVSSWSEGSLCPIYNIWSPAYFGIVLSRPHSKPYKLTRNDLIVTRYEGDTALLKAKDAEPIPFKMEDVISGIDVDYPGFLCCKCCFRYRGWVTLGDGERWRFDEIAESYYQFQRVHERMHDGEFPNVYRRTLLWERYSDWKSGYGEAPAEIPFTMDQDTRLCRINPDQNGKRHWNASTLVTPVIAIMNPEGLVFVDGLKESVGIETDHLRELVLMTGLAIAKFERPALENENPFSR